MDVDESPLAVFLPVDLGLDAVRRDRRAVLAQDGVKIPVGLRPRGVAVQIDRHVMHLEVARRERSGHDLHEDILRNGVEAVLFA